MRKRICTMGLLMVCAMAPALAQQTYVDLTALFDSDAVLEAGGAGLGAALNDQGDRIDALTLPSSYNDGAEALTQDGRTSFLFGPLQQASLDALAVNGQVLDIPDGVYQYVDLAMLSAPGSMGDPFGNIEFRYADGSIDAKRFGPIAGWLSSPTAFENTFYRYTDDSQVQSIVSFSTNFGADEAKYILLEKGNGNSGGNRFIDGTGYVLYVIDGLENVKQATLGVTVGNNFVISISAYYGDPESAATEGYTVLANSMDLYGGFEHRALGNLKNYEFDISPYLAENTGEIYILLTDATTSNGWGPYLQRISLYTGKSNTFEETLSPEIDAAKAAVYALFQTNGNDEEKKFLYDNSGSGPSNRGHRFADGNGSITYRFDLPDDAVQAKAVVDMANNFIVSLSGPTGAIRYNSMTVGTADEHNYLIDEGGSIPGGDFRFADGNAYMVYQFDLPDDVTTAFAQINVGNQFVVEIAPGTDGAFTVAKDWVAESGQETTDNSNLTIYTFDLTNYLKNNSSKIVRFRFSDGIPTNGWGPYLKSILIVNKVETGEAAFEEVLNSMTMYGVDIHNETNKQYYTIDLAPTLQNNPTKEVFIKFTDASTGDGWGPGIFAMAVFSGELSILSDNLVFNDLKNTSGNPANFGLDLLQRRYTIDPSKKLDKIAFPHQSAIDADKIYLLAATLTAGGSAVSDWMLQ
ncbi:MAG: hypothetical protein AB1656_26120 [Candidatus Omnitrophota bacterium]